MTVKSAKEGDFVYFEPPYQPLSETSKFTSYTKEDFTKEDQMRLAKKFKEMDKKGCLVMVSNSYAPLLAD